MFAIGPNGKRASLWVDAEGKLITTVDPEDASELPEGARIAQALRVNEQGALLTSGGGGGKAGEVVVAELVMPSAVGASVIDKSGGTVQVNNIEDLKAGYLQFNGTSSAIRVVNPIATRFSAGVGIALEFEFTYLTELNIYPTLFTSYLSGGQTDTVDSIAIFLSNAGLGLSNTVGLYRTNRTDVALPNNSLVPGQDYSLIVGRDPGGQWFIELNGVTTTSSYAPDTGDVVFDGPPGGRGFQVGDTINGGGQGHAHMNLRKFLFKVFR